MCVKMKLGDWGEEVASKYLIAKGYEILERNFRCRTGEIDLVTQQQDTLVFVEVKSRRSIDFGVPCEAITAVKRRRLKSAIGYYLLLHPGERILVRVDAVEILVIRGKGYLRHLENIF